MMKNDALCLRPGNVIDPFIGYRGRSFICSEGSFSTRATRQK
jgi:hypothetical protein